MRDNIIMSVIGKQRIGKTTQTRADMLGAYLRGFKVLIFDPNDEPKLKAFLGAELLAVAKSLVKTNGPGCIKIDLSEAKANPSKSFYIPRLAYNADESDVETRVKHISKYSTLKGCGIRRISPLRNADKVDAGKSMTKDFLPIKQKVQVAKDILAFFRPSDAGQRNGFVFLDDINNYVLNMHQDEEFIGTLMNINHRGVDIVVHYHDPMQIPPVLYRFGSIIRLHKTVKKVQKAEKIPYEILKLAEAIVDEAYKENQRFFLYIDAAEGVISGASEQQFKIGARHFLAQHPAIWRQYGSPEKCIDGYLIDWLKK